MPCVSPTPPWRRHRLCIVCLRGDDSACAVCVPTASAAKTPLLPCVFLLFSGLRHRLCRMVFPLPSRRRQRLCLVYRRGLRGEDSACALCFQRAQWGGVFALCVPIAFVTKTPPVNCVRPLQPRLRQRLCRVCSHCLRVFPLPSWLRHCLCVFLLPPVKQRLSLVRAHRLYAVTLITMSGSPC